MTDTNRYLATYDGPQGPISAAFSAASIDDAAAIAARDGRSWFAAGEDALGLPEDAPAEVVVAAAKTAGYSVAIHAHSDSDWTIWHRA